MLGESNGYPNRPQCCWMGGDRLPAHSPAIPNVLLAYPPFGMPFPGPVSGQPRLPRRTLEFAESLETTLWFSLAQPFPISQFYAEAQHEGTIIESDFSKYGNTCIVYLPAGVTYEEMHRIQTQAEELRLKQDVKYRIVH